MTADDNEILPQKKVHLSSPSLQFNNDDNNNNNRMRNDDFHDSPPASQFNDDSNTPDNFNSLSSSRTTLLAFLLLVGIAITHAIMSGFENMHESKKKQTQHNSQQSEGFDYSFVQETDDAVSFSSANMNIANNEEIYDSRSVTNADEVDLDTMGDFPAATILSRATQLNSLILHLDASDVVECYVVTRMAHLTNNMDSTYRGGGENNDDNRRKVHRMLDESLAFASNKNSAADQKEELDKDGTSSSSSSSSTSSTGTSNIPSGPVLIRKSALAFRYHPRVASTHNGPHFSTDYSSSVPLDNLSPGDHLEQQKYFELTLEYGPQRTGVAKTSESVPIVHVDMESGGQTNSNIGKYVSWENEGRIYHTTQISGEWTEAYYMASITGVVLEKIIQRAVEYTYKRPRYQPFEVVSIPSQQLLLRSSGSDDFVLEMFRDLAELYVDIDPLLVPPRGRVQFYVSDPEVGTSDDDGRRGNGSEGFNDIPNSIPPKQPNSKANPNVKKVKGPVESSLAAVFYENFFNCAHAIKSGDYSMYLPPPSLAPTAMPSSVSMVPSNMPSIYTGGNLKNATIKTTIEGKEDEDKETYSNAHEYGDANSTAVIEGTKDDNHNNDNYRENNTAAQFDDDQHHGGRRLSENHQINNVTIDEEEIVLDALKTNPELIDEEKGDDITPGLSLDDDDITLLDSSDLDDTEGSEDDPAELAEKAAIEAAEKAADAAAIVATNSSSAADTAAATIEASKAAQKAKEASVAARSKASAEALISGNGEEVTSVLSNCFSDPKYGIRRQEEIHHDKEGSGEEEKEFLGEGKKGEEKEHKESSVVAYIYLDGDVFFRLNLVPPYWGVVSSKITVPPPAKASEGRGDAIDWGIFMLILMGTLFGFLVMLHQVGIVIDKRLQFRNIFHPTMSESDWASEDNQCGIEGEKSPLKQVGGGHSHSELRFLSPQSIPTSMMLNNGSDTEEYPDSNTNDGIDLEMSELRPSNGSSKSPHKVRFDSGLVERPTLKTISKIALPKQSPNSPDSDVDNKKVKFNTNKALPELPLGA